MYISKLPINFQVTEMVNAIVEHKWNESDQTKVFEVVGNIVDMAKSGKLPSGFKLNYVNVVASERRAICGWDAPSAEGLRKLVDQVNPPTTHVVNEAMKIF